MTCWPTGCWPRRGAPAQSPRPALPGSASPAFRRLEEVGQRMLQVIARNRGGTNKDLGKFADQLRSLIEKWDR